VVVGLASGVARRAAVSWRKRWLAVLHRRGVKGRAREPALYYLCNSGNVPILAGDSVVDRRRVHCRLNLLPKPDRFSCLITRTRGIRLCLMTRRTFLAGT
jgi:hypothetical protein